jgi:hypothetical protein
MLAMVYEHINVHKSAQEWKDELETRVKVAIKEAETRVRVEFQGWESSEDEGPACCKVQNRLTVGGIHIHIHGREIHSRKSQFKIT